MTEERNPLQAAEGSIRVDSCMGNCAEAAGL